MVADNKKLPRVVSPPFFFSLRADKKTKDSWLRTRRMFLQILVPRGVQGTVHTYTTFLKRSKEKFKDGS